MEFRCRLATASGQVTEGVYVADSEAALRRDFEDKGLFVLDVKSAGGGLASLRRSRGGRIKLHEFLVFNQELATLLKAGMPLVQSLEILRRNVPNPTFKTLLDDVYEKVRSGTALSEAFEAHPRHVTPIYTASLMAGERSGSLEQVLRRYVAYVQVLGAVRRKVVSALVYPAVLTLLSFAVVAIIVVRVVPEFNQFYQGFDAELPLATRVIVAVSDAIRRGSSSLPWRLARRCWVAMAAASARAAPAGGQVDAAAARSRGIARSSPPRSWRARWRRCSCAASRW